MLLLFGDVERSVGRVAEVCWVVRSVYRVQTDWPSSFVEGK